MIVGVDEVGRGSWAGPVVAAAVVLSNPLRGLKDSKQLSPIQRQRLAYVIRRHALSIGIGWVPAQIVDKAGLSFAVKEAMRQAVEQINVAYERIIIDGKQNFLGHLSAETLIKADSIIPAVSAASIIAKVARDNYMIYMSRFYPNYQFESHVGYGTPAHRQNLRQYGICQLHRLSYRPVKLLAGL